MNTPTVLTIEDYTGDFTSRFGSKKEFNVSKDKNNTLEFITFLLENNSTSSSVTKKLNPSDYRLLINSRTLPTNEKTIIDFDEIQSCTAIRLLKK